MCRHVLAILLLFTPLQPIFAEDVWVFLKDGTLCQSSMSGTTHTGHSTPGKSIRFIDEQVQCIRTSDEIDKSVDAMIVDLVSGKKFDEHASQFKVLRMSAVPALLKHLANEPVNERLGALYGLCFCWTPTAREPVMAVFRNSNPTLFRAAFHVLERNISAEELGACVRDWADDPDDVKAAMVFSVVEQTAPDPTHKRGAALAEQSLRAEFGRAIFATLFFERSGSRHFESFEIPENH